MSKETLKEMMDRINDDKPSSKWVNTSIGLVNMGNKNAAAIAADKLRRIKEARNGKLEDK